MLMKEQYLDYEQVINENVLSWEEKISSLVGFEICCASMRRLFLYRHVGMDFIFVAR